MTRYLSDKIKIVSLFSIILVLYIHSGFTRNQVGDFFYVDLIQNIFSHFMGRLAVPMFFCISGYLFFLNANILKELFPKIKKRGKTLVIPFFIGSLYFISFFLLIRVIPGIEKFVNSDFEKKLPNGIFKFVRDLFFKDGTGSPIAFHLWFLRNLYLIVLASPLFFLFNKYFGPIWLIPVFILSLFYDKWEIFYSFFFFGFGGSILFKKLTLFTIPKHISVIIFITYLIICVFEFLTSDQSIWKDFRIILELWGVISIWIIYDFLVPDNFVLINNPVLRTICEFTFFIYLFHEPTLNIVRKFIIFILGKNELGYMFSYLFSPWIFMALAIPVGILLKKKIPKPYAFATGGR